MVGKEDNIVPILQLLLDLLQDVSLSTADLSKFIAGQKNGPEPVEVNGIAIFQSSIFTLQSRVGGTELELVLEAVLNAILDGVEITMLQMVSSIIEGQGYGASRYSFGYFAGCLHNARESVVMTFSKLADIHYSTVGISPTQWTLMMQHVSLSFHMFRIPR